MKINDMNEIREVLKINDDIKGEDNFSKLEDILSRGIPLEPYQANMIFLGRGYGKTHMSFIESIMRIKDKLKSIKNNKDIYQISIGIYADNDMIAGGIDSDVISINMKKAWLDGFSNFLNKYYKDLKFKRKENKLTFHKKDNDEFTNKY